MILRNGLSSSGENRNVKTKGIKDLYSNDNSIIIPYQGCSKEISSTVERMAHRGCFVGESERRYTVSFKV